ncbi:MerR family transcriptional regulator [Bacteroidales bacterium OttesenSCG-928-C19]|nr:MerR family transcriptional regulator [Bacteroidales bacterium OttesenSCG-928-C19]
MTGKLYYSIGEVAEMFDVNASLLRFWEKEFDSISPFKNAKGTRYYTDKDIEAIRQIYYLTKECGFTIEGAREQMKSKKDTIAAKAEAVNTMRKMKAFLLELKKELD